MIRKNKTVTVIAALVSLLFGTAYCLTPILSKKGGPFDILAIPRGALFYGLSLVIVYFAARWYRDHAPAGASGSDRKIFIGFVAAHFLIGLFWLLVYYPGVGNYDTISIMRGYKAIMTQHPWFYCLIIHYIAGTILHFGGTAENVFFVHGLIQLMYTGLITAHCVIWLKNKGLARWPLILISAFFLLDPMLNLFKVTLLKDIPYSYMLLEWLMLLYDLWESRGESLKKKSTVLWMALCVVLSLLRNNGIYVTAFILMCLFIAYRKQWKQILLLTFVFVLTVAGSIQYERSNGITHLFKETVGIPLQQIGAVVYNDGVMTQEQAEFIDNVISLDYIKENYYPYTADKLKWGGAPLKNDYLNAHKHAFLRVWGEMLIPNFRLYVKAYLQITYGFWKTNTQGILKYTTLYVEALDGWFKKADVGIQNVFPEPIQTRLKTITYDSLLAMGEGQLLWTFLFLMILLHAVKDSGIWIIAAPAMGGWLTVMISTPTAHQWRYVLFFPLMIPLLLGLLLVKGPEEETPDDPQQA